MSRKAGGVASLFLGAVLAGGVGPGVKRSGSTPRPHPVCSSLISISAAGNFLVAVNPDSDSISIVDIASRRLIVEIPVGPNPQTVSLDLQRGWAWVTNRDNDTVSVVNLNAGEPIAVLPVGDEPFGVVVGKEGLVFISNTGSDSISVIAADSLQPLATISTYPHPRGLALSADGTRLYVTHFFSGVCF